MVAGNVVEKDGLIVQADEFGDQGQGDELAVAEGGVGTRTVVMGKDGGLEELIDDDIGIGAQILEGLYHGWVSLLRAVLSTAAVS